MYGASTWLRVLSALCLRHCVLVKLEVGVVVAEFRGSCLTASRGYFLTFASPTSNMGVGQKQDFAYASASNICLPSSFVHLVNNPRAPLFFFTLFAITIYQLIPSQLLPAPFAVLLSSFAVPCSHFVHTHCCVINSWASGFLLL